VSERAVLNGEMHVSKFNRLITSKKVAFSFSEHYEFSASVLGEMNLAMSQDPTLRSNAEWQRTNWCALVTYLRTVFNQKS
jgi:hypothetical protein